MADWKQIKKLLIISSLQHFDNFCNLIDLLLDVEILLDWQSEIILLYCFGEAQLVIYLSSCLSDVKSTLKPRFMGPTWGPSGADRTQVGPMLAPWTLLSGLASNNWFHGMKSCFNYTRLHNNNILSSNFRRCVGCKVYCKILKFEFKKKKKNCNFYFVWFWLWILYESLVWVIIGWQGVSFNAGILVVLVESDLLLMKAWSCGHHW